MADAFDRKGTHLLTSNHDTHPSNPSLNWCIGSHTQPCSLQSSRRWMEAVEYEIICSLLLLCTGEGFKARAFRKSAGIIAGHSKKVESGKELKHMAGIGKATMDKVTALLHKDS